MKAKAPITGEQIAESLGLSRPTIRSDLALLVMLGLLDAKPKVGYFVGTPSGEAAAFHKLDKLKIGDVLSVPVVIKDTATVQDAVITLFMENVGSLIVSDSKGKLAGVISRKDLLKVTVGNAAASTMPVSMVMTREPNVITVTPLDSVLEAARLLIRHQVDSLPVMSAAGPSEAADIVGRVTKTTMTKLLIELGGGGWASE